MQQLILPGNNARGGNADVPAAKAATLHFNQNAMNNNLTVMNAHISRLLAALALALCAALPLCAQHLSVCGKGLNKKTGETLPLISAQLIASDSTLYAVALSEKDGSFCVETDSAGTYQFRLSCIGFDSYSRPVTLSAEQPRIDLGDIRLAPNAIALETADVVGRASALTIRKDTFVYSTKAMNVDAGTTISALISQMPGVEMDEEGNLVWQGKKVESLLVNGKKFFGGDIKAALQNMPSEMVENLKLYDKKSDFTERTGVDDGERTTVLDVGVKKEYVGSWSGNMAAGGGYEDKWTGRAFLSRFSDRLQVSAAGKANNLNGDERVDQNGNWSNSGFRLGWSELRSTNASLAWTSKDNRQAAGFQEVNGYISFRHDNTDQRNDRWQENYLPGQDRVWWNSRGRTRSAYEDLLGNLSYSINIDTLNFLSFYFSAGKTGNESDGRNASATMNADPQLHFEGHPLDHVFGNDLPESVSSLLVNTMDERFKTDNDSRKYYGQLSYNLRLPHTQDVFQASAGLSSRENDNDRRRFYDGVTYTNGIEHDINRQFNPGTVRNLNSFAELGLFKQVGKQVWWNTRYRFDFNRNRDDNLYYRLDRLPGWTDLQLHPLAQVPAELAELARLLDENSRWQTTYFRQHAWDNQVNGTVGKVEFSARAFVSYGGDDIVYDRPQHDRIYKERHNFGFQGNAWGKYKFSDRTSISISYNGSTVSPQLTDMLDVTDTSNPQTSFEGNPGLKKGWSNHGNMNFSTFVERLQLSFWANANGGNTSNMVATKMTYNPETGYYRNRPENVNGSWYAGSGAGFSMTLDKEKRWNLNASVFDYFNHSVGFLSVGEGDAQLNKIKSNTFTCNMGLSYRNKELFVSANVMLNPQSYRSSLQPESDENGFTHSYKAAVTWTAPFGLRISTDFELWSRRNFLTRSMNTDQWLWNASISQSFLRDKSLTLKVEATDILDSRTSDMHRSDAFSNSTSHYNSYQRYVVATLIYRFAWGKKRT